MRFVDLTLTVSKSIPTFPGSPAPQFIAWSTLKEDGYNMELLFLSSHTGTHMDAPFHFVSNGAKIHEIPVRRFLGNGILVNVPKRKDNSITMRDVKSFERKNGEIAGGASIFFHTGWQKFLKNNDYFTKNPYLSEKVAEYLASKKINMIGIDSPSVDRGSDCNFPVHTILSKKDILIVENLANLDKIGKEKFDFAILPLKLRDGTGSPVRAIAF